MAKERLSKAAFVERGYGQVEPNHLSAQRTGQIYAQLPAAADIEMLENGQFVKYDYANEEVNFTGLGEWMLVFNEVKVYRDFLGDADFAMIRDNYMAHVFSPVGVKFGDTETPYTSTSQGRDYSDIVAPADEFEPNYTMNPFVNVKYAGPKMMKDGTKMVPRVFKTNVGDIFTTNCVNVEEPALGDLLAPNAEGYLEAAGEDATMKWQVVKVYDLADRQKAVKLMRVA